MHFLVRSMQGTTVRLRPIRTLLLISIVLWQHAQLYHEIYPGGLQTVQYAVEDLSLESRTVVLLKHYRILVIVFQCLGHSLEHKEKGEEGEAATLDHHNDLHLAGGGNLD